MFVCVILLLCFQPAAMQIALGEFVAKPPWPRAMPGLGEAPKREWARRQAGHCRAEPRCLFAWAAFKRWPGFAECFRC